MVQLKDIAKHLNLSVATVSKAINGKGRISAETRQRVLSAIEELGYKPNEIARSLRRRTANTIGVIVPDLTNIFYSNVIKGVEKVAWENGYSVIVCNSDEDAEKESAYLQLLLQHQIAGLVIAMVGREVKQLDPYKKAGIPVVFFDNMPKTKDNFDVVTIDNVKASYELTQHLIDQGHQNIAFITGPLHQSTAYDRLQGYQQCMKHHALSIEDKWVSTGEFKFEHGYKVMKKWLADEDKPQAVLAANNFLLYGVMKAAREAGLNIPNDLAVACFDAHDETGLICPQITSVLQPDYDIGVIAGEIIMRKEKNKVTVYEKMILEPQMIIRESSLTKK